MAEDPSRLVRLYRAGTRGLPRSRQTEPFYPAGSRKPLKWLWPPKRIEHFAARLWQPPCWEVEVPPSAEAHLRPGDLDFFYVDREIVTARNTQATHVTDERRVERLDLLLCNCNDRMPIVAELKIKKDENAFYALIQALAHVAQLQSKTQRKRLAKVYPDFFPEPPPKFDIYLLMFAEKKSRTRQELSDRAKTLAKEIVDDCRELRRIACLDSRPENDHVGFTTRFAFGD